MCTNLHYNGLAFKLWLAMQTGSYIKEFVYDDFMQTRPNLREVLGGCNIDILALDVEFIENIGLTR